MSVAPVPLLSHDQDYTRYESQELTFTQVASENYCDDDLKKQEELPLYPSAPQLESHTFGDFLVWSLKSLLFCNKPVDETWPLFRGKIHLLLVYAAPIWAGVLYYNCSSVLAYVAVSICVLCSVVNFAASACLHNVGWESATHREILRKLDHSGIFLMIAGSCAPVPMLLFAKKSMIVILSVQWGASLAGIATVLFGKSFSSDSNNGVRAAVYCIIGLANFAFSFEFLKVTTILETCFLVAMACSYVVGATFYGCKRPLLWPKVFSYHELFHCCCLLAFFFTLAVDLSVLIRVKR